MKLSWSEVHPPFNLLGDSIVMQKKKKVGIANNLSVTHSSWYGQPSLDVYSLFG